MEVRALAKTAGHFPIFVIAAALLSLGLSAGPACAQTPAITTGAAGLTSFLCCCMPVLIVLGVLFMLIIIWAAVGVTLADIFNSKNLRRRFVYRFGKGPILGDGGGVVYEKEVVHEVVKVPCKYCGTLVEVTSQNCPSCGAPLKP